MHEARQLNTRERRARSKRKRERERSRRARAVLDAMASAGDPRADIIAFAMKEMSKSLTLAIEDAILNGESVKMRIGAPAKTYSWPGGLKLTK